MEIPSAIAAAVAVFMFGGAGHDALAKPLMAATGKTEEQVEGGAMKSPAPYIISFIMLLPVCDIGLRMRAGGGLERKINFKMSMPLSANTDGYRDNTRYSDYRSPSFCHYFSIG